ncbi:ABC transporter substrate-binding protein [Actibacterium ureilyticum]|uniref:ABC transporter substrate-binding protein n=1 Tax=Actibacterium ureilyticum TaxID=1590614 RepID=UPI000BAB17F3|nr:ABC transporter substrate-binding protein [Actibacterium ureilyticum]
MLAGGAQAADLEVVHWWTSGGEAAAVQVLADAFNATGHRWVDGAIAGGGGTQARPAVISRLLGGDPMGATQFNHGQQARELVEAGLMLDLTELAQAENWHAVVHPPDLLQACTVNGRIYCVPVNIHSWQWLWLSTDAFHKAGLEVPQDWAGFVAAAPALRRAGIVPLAIGPQDWEASNAITQVLAVAIAGPDAWRAVNVDRDAAVARGADYAAVFQAAETARAMSRGSHASDWNQATGMVIDGRAGGQIMGDWAQGEFAAAGLVAGKDYECLPGLGMTPVISTGGDAFYFPKQDDPDVTAAQLKLASVMMSPKVQVAFNTAKGALPVRGDVDLDTANSCMRKGLAILSQGQVLPSTEIVLPPDTVAQIDDLMARFWASPDMTAAEVQDRYADLIARAR